MAARGSSGVVFVALVANLAIAVTKFAAAALTGSSALLATSIHSLVDVSSQALLLLGLGRVAPDGETATSAKELHFWGFVVAMLLFSMGASVSIYEGVHRALEPVPVTDPQLGYIVLGLALVLTGFSTWRALDVAQQRYSGQGVLYALRRADDAALLTLVVESFAALAGIAIALAGITAAHLLQLPWADGAASIAVGLLLAAVAAFMSLEIRRVIVGADVIGASVSEASRIAIVETTSTEAEVVKDVMEREASAAALPPTADIEQVPVAKAVSPPVAASAPAVSPAPGNASQKGGKAASKSSRKGRPRPR